MFLLLLFGGVLCEQKSSICDICVNLIGMAANHTRSGMSLKKLNQTLLAECDKLSFFMKVGCKTYVKNNVAEVYKKANTTKQTPLDICTEKGACKSEL